MLTFVNYKTKLSNQLPEVKTAVHADKQMLGWKECTSLVSAELHGDQSKPAYYVSFIKT